MSLQLFVWDVIDFFKIKDASDTYTVKLTEATINRYKLRSSNEKDVWFRVRSREPIPVGRIVVFRNGTDVFHYQPEYYPTLNELKQLYLPVSYEEGPKWVIYKDLPWMCLRVKQTNAGWELKMRRPFQCDIYLLPTANLQCYINYPRSI